MKYLVILSGLVSCFVGCSKKDNPLNSVTEDGLVFTLTAAKTTLDPNDTLIATVQVYNQSPEQVELSVDWEWFFWQLKNDKGDTVAAYFGGVIPLGEHLYINSHQSISIEEYSINHYPSGAVQPGNYSLQAEIERVPINEPNDYPNNQPVVLTLMLTVI